MIIVINYVICSMFHILEYGIYESLEMITAEDAEDAEENIQTLCVLCELCG